MCEEFFDRDFDTLEELADLIGAALQCSVTIEDNHHRLLAYSSHGPQTDSARIATIIGRRVPEHVIRALWREGVIQRLMASDLPQRVSAIDEIGLGNRMAIAIRKNQEVLGYIWLLEVEKHLDDSSITVLVKAAQAAKSKLLQLQMKKRKAEQSVQDFLWELISGYFDSHEDVKEKALKIGLSLPGSVMVTVIQFAADISDKLHQQIQYALMAIQKLRMVTHIVHQNRLILLSSAPARLSPGEQAQPSPQWIEPFLHHLDGISMEIASGAVYEDYAQAEQSYQEALALLHIKSVFGENMKSVFAYPEMGFYRFLPAMLAEALRHPMEHPVIRKLKQYDREHGGDLLRTLEVFLRYDSNLKETADVLHVHANTLNYRLKRIGEVGGVNLNLMDQKVSLFLELKLEKLRAQDADPDAQDAPAKPAP